MSFSYDAEDRICINSRYQTKGDKRVVLRFLSSFNQTEFMLSKCQKPASAQ